MKNWSFLQRDSDFHGQKTSNASKTSKKINFRNVQRPLPVIVLTLYTLFDLFNTKSNKFQARILPDDVNLVRNLFDLVISGVYVEFQVIYNQF